MGRDQALRQNLRLAFLGASFFAGGEGATSLLEIFFESAADGHHFAARLHLRAEGFVGSGEFFELPLRNFYNYVVEGGLEAGRSLLRDVVGNFVERVANG